MIGLLWSLCSWHRDPVSAFPPSFLWRLKCWQKSSVRIWIVVVVVVYLHVCVWYFVTYGETWVALLLSEQCYPLLSACYPLLSACAVLSLCPNNAAASEILTHTQMSTHATAHGGCTGRAKGCTGSWLWEKIPRCTGDSNPSALHLALQSDAGQTETRTHQHCAWLSSQTMDKRRLEPISIVPGSPVRRWTNGAVPALLDYTYVENCDPIRNIWKWKILYNV